MRGTPASCLLCGSNRESPGNQETMLSVSCAGGAACHTRVPIIVGLTYAQAWPWATPRPRPRPACRAVHGSVQAAGSAPFRSTKAAASGAPSRRRQTPCASPAPAHVASPSHPTPLPAPQGRARGAADHCCGGRIDLGRGGMASALCRQAGGQRPVAAAARDCSASAAAAARVPCPAAPPLAGPRAIGTPHLQHAG